MRASVVLRVSRIPGLDEHRDAALVGRADQGAQVVEVPDPTVDGEFLEGANHPTGQPGLERRPGRVPDPWSDDPPRSPSRTGPMGWKPLLSLKKTGTLRPPGGLAWMAGSGHRRSGRMDASAASMPRTKKKMPVLRPAAGGKQDAAGHRRGVGAGTVSCLSRSPMGSRKGDGFVSWVGPLRMRWQKIN